MNVLLLIGQLSPGGAERQCVNLAKVMNGEGFGVHVGVLSNLLDFAYELEEANVPVSVMYKRGRYDFSVVPRLVGFIRSNGVDLVHTFLYSANVVGTLAGVLAGVPVVISERSCPPTLSLEKRLMYRVLAYMADAVVVNAHATKRLLVDKAKISAQKVFVHPNGVDLSIFNNIPIDRKDLRNKYGIPEDSFVIGTVGRLIRVKNHELVLMTAAQLRKLQANIRFVIVGDATQGEDSAYRDYLFSLHKSFGLQDVVTFVGMQRDPARFMRMFDVFILTSLWEATPNVLLEAMAAGIPVIATDVGDVREILTASNAGLVVPSTPDSFAHAILYLLSNSQVMGKMGQAGQEYVRLNFSIEKLAENTRRLWESLVMEAS